MLGNRTNLHVAAKLGTATNARDADAFASNVLPMIQLIQGGGAASLRAVSEALNVRNVKTARGGTWTAMTVQRILHRAAHRP